jgi:Domain of unknown function (DUF4270)
MNKYKERSTKALLRFSGAKFFLLVIAGIAVLTISSCDKASTVGLGVQPINDLLNVGYVDSTTLVTKTVKEDHLRTDQNLLISGQAMIGKYIDPVFGEADASLYTQLRMTTDILPTSYSFGHNPVCDSAVLCLTYGNAMYGESVGKRPLRKQTINVYEIMASANSAIAYYSDTTVQINAGNDLAANHSFIPDISEPVYITQYHAGIRKLDTLTPQLRVPLQPLFGQTILNNQTTSNLTISTFPTFMKGLYITANNTSGLGEGEGRILTYNLAANTSVMRIYYHNDSTHNGNVLYFDFYTSSVPRFATFSRVQPATILDTVQTKYTSYIESMGGAKTKIQFPYLLNLIKQGNIAVNKAELVVKVDPSTLTWHQDSYEPPTALLLFGIADDGTSYLLPDLTETPYYYNGSYDATNHQYVLNISRYIQQLLDKKVNNNGAYLVVPHISAATKANRVVIGGGSKLLADGITPNPLVMKLNITYTKLH